MSTQLRPCMSSGLSLGQTCQGLTLTSVFSSWVPYGDLVLPFLYLVAGAGCTHLFEFDGTTQGARSWAGWKNLHYGNRQAHKSQLCFLDGWLLNTQHTPFLWAPSLWKGFMTALALCCGGWGLDDRHHTCKGCSMWYKPHNQTPLSPRRLVLWVPRLNLHQCLMHGAWLANFQLCLWRHSSHQAVILLAYSQCQAGPRQGSVFWLSQGEDCVVWMVLPAFAPLKQ